MLTPAKYVLTASLEIPSEDACIVALGGVYAQYCRAVTLDELCKYLSQVPFVASLKILIVECRGYAFDIAFAVNHKAILQLWQRVWTFDEAEYPPSTIVDDDNL